MKWLVLLALLSSPSNQDPVPEYTIRYTSVAPRIDGDISEPEWKSAPELTLSFPWPGQTGEKQVTRARLLWDEHNLYIGFSVADRDIAAKYLQRDDPTYEDDAVELFFNPFPQRSSYIGLEINARGVLYDYLKVQSEKLYPNYDLKGVAIATSIDGTLNQAADVDRGWTVEIAIPLSNFIDKWDRADVRAGTVWTMNVSRWDGRAPDRVFSIWSDPHLDRPDPHAPARFGRLIFAR